MVNKSILLVKLYFLIFETKSAEMFEIIQHFKAEENRNPWQDKENKRGGIWGKKNELQKKENEKPPLFHIVTSPTDAIIINL